MGMCRHYPVGDKKLTAKAQTIELEETSGGIFLAVCGVSLQKYQQQAAGYVLL